MKTLLRQIRSYGDNNAAHPRIALESHFSKCATKFPKGARLSRPVAGTDAGATFHAVAITALCAVGSKGCSSAPWNPASASIFWNSPKV